MPTLTQHAIDAGSATVQTKLSYITAAATGTVSVMTFNQVIGAVGVVLSILIAGFTAWSNHKKNKAIIDAVANTVNVKELDR